MTSRDFYLLVSSKKKGVLFIDRVRDGELKACLLYRIKNRRRTTDTVRLRYGMVKLRRAIRAVSIRYAVLNVTCFNRVMSS